MPPSSPRLSPPRRAYLYKPFSRILLPLIAHSPIRISTRSNSTFPSPSPPLPSIQGNNLPLSGLRVLDLSRVLAGPFCTQLLADYGANVLKIEQPHTGDETRLWRTKGEAQIWKKGGKSGNSKEYDLMSLYFVAINRNKRSLTLNLKSKAGQAIIRRLVEEWKPDVLVENFLPGKLSEMGLDYDSVRKWRGGEKLVYASVSGYGASGPMKARAGYDAIALAESGLLHITGEEGGRPVKPGVAIGDLCTGLYLHGAILAKLREREGTGRGGRVEGSLLESALSLLINVGLGAVNLDLDAEKTDIDAETMDRKGKGTARGKRRRGKKLGLGHASLVPYGGFETKDKRWFFIAANNNRQWKGFCAKMDIPGLADDERFQSNDGRVENRKEIDGRLQARFKEGTLGEWEELFEGSGLPYGRVADVVEALEGRQSLERGMVREIQAVEAAKDGVLRVLGSAVKFPGEHSDDDGVKGLREGGAIGDVSRKPPLLGEHTDEVLGELGIGLEERGRLREEGVV